MRRRYSTMLHKDKFRIHPADICSIIFYREKSRRVRQDQKQLLLYLIINDNSEIDKIISITVPNTRRKERQLQ